MQLSPLNWQSLYIEHSFQTGDFHHFLDFQPNVKLAFEQLSRNRFGSALVLKTETFPEFLNEICGYFQQWQIKTMLLTEFNRERLFGYSLFLEKENRLENIQGAIQQANKGILILNINSLLLDISQWDKLKQALLFGEYQPIYANKLPNQLANIHCQFKLILVGSRNDIATLFEYDDSLYQFCQYSEIDSYLQLDQDRLNQWGSYIQSYANKWIDRSFSNLGLNQLLRQYIRESEDQNLISISPTLLKKYLYELSQFYPEQQRLDDIQTYFDYIDQQSSVLKKFALQDILSHQLYIETEEEEVGQINGLSVVEFNGVPHSFGEPLRISCNVQYGDGEIQDIERKVELGGNIHAKGIMLAQACLSNLLELPSQLPFSASLAFEQSYGEIDGDSSSLAIFCVLISALTKLPVPQSIAITGAIDQFGNVLSVGGVNQKIEGFFDLCQARGLTGKQGVIIPAVCQSQLSLKAKVLAAIKAEQFFIWAVSDVFEATQLLFDHEFYNEDVSAISEKLSLFALVHKYIDAQESAASPLTIWQKCCKKWFN